MEWFVQNGIDVWRAKEGQPSPPSQGCMPAAAVTNGAFTVTAIAYFQLPACNIVQHGDGGGSGPRHRGAV